jgi:hypothetical protein
MATTTNYSWTTPDDTALVKDGAAAIRSLGTAIDTTVFNNASAAIAKTIVDAKGDIIAATAADTVARLAVGTNGQVLKANSATATGLEWGSAGGGGKSFALLNSGGTALSGSSTTISSLSGYDQFLVVCNDVSGTSNTNIVNVQFNSDTGSNYSRWGGKNAAASTYDKTAVVESIRDLSNTQIEWIRGPGSTSSTNGAGSMFIHGANTSGVKVFQCHSGFDVGTGDNGQTQDFQGIWNNSSVISSITFKINFGTFDAGTVYIYGAV